MSDPKPIPPPEDERAVDDTVIDLETVVSAFLAAFPTPTDQQLHQFSTLLGIDYKVFEEMVFKMFGDALQGESIEDILDDEDIVEDDLDLFIVSFFTFNSAPTEEQIHTLAEMISITPEDIEERVYRMLQGISGPGDDEEDDEDELNLDDPEGEEDPDEEDDEEELDSDEEDSEDPEEDEEAAEEDDDTGGDDQDPPADDDEEDDSEEDSEDDTESEDESTKA